MTPILPKPERHSQRLYRRQRLTQILLPVLLSVLLMVSVVVLLALAAFKPDGDSARWSAISTIWLLIPVMIAGLLVLALLVGLVYLLSRALGGLPHYTALAQDYVYLAHDHLVRGANGVVKPLISFQAHLLSLKAFIERMILR